MTNETPASVVRPNAGNPPLILGLVIVDSFHFIEFLFFRILAVSGLMFCVAVGKNALIWPTKTAWLLITLTATVDTVVSRALYYLVLRRLQMSVHAIVMALNSIAAISWTYLFFDIAPTAQQLFGGVGILVGVSMVIIRQRN
jgi:drug/metabolite transporter (DMT)-like permease